MARTDYVSLIEALVRDDAGLISATQRDDALILAVLRYSDDRPPEGGGAHVLSTAEDTIPPGDREAVCAYAAALLLEQLAARHAGDGDSTIQADAVDRQFLSDRYLKLARGHRARYASLLGLDETPPAAGMTATLGRRPGRRAGLTH